MDVTVAEPGSVRQKALFLYGMGTAVGLYVGLVNLYLSRSPGAFFFFFGAAMVFTTWMLVLWQEVFPRLLELAGPWRSLLQIIICLASFATLALLTGETHFFLFGRIPLLGPHQMFHPYNGGALTLTIPAETMRYLPIVFPLIPILAISVLCIVGFNYHWWRMVLMQGRERELRDLAAAAQLAVLRAQINPHFFFNSLNSIAQLIHSDPDKAEACVERLGEIFHYLLGRTEAEFVTLADELHVAEAYLEIERARFGDALVVQEEIDEEARAVIIPGLVLQPLVENAVRHGISPKVGGGAVAIRASMDNGSLRLTVSDTGVGIRPGDTIFERGVGLRSVRDRLLKLYGTDYAPTISSADGSGTTVTLRIPLTHRFEGIMPKLRRNVVTHSGAAHTHPDGARR